jgi:hypothetical protein
MSRSVSRSNHFTSRQMQRHLAMPKQHFWPPGGVSPRAPARKSTCLSVRSTRKQSRIYGSVRRVIGVIPKGETGYADEVRGTGRQLFRSMPGIRPGSEAGGHPSFSRGRLVPADQSVAQVAARNADACGWASSGRKAVSHHVLHRVRSRPSGPVTQRGVPRI